MKNWRPFFPRPPPSYQRSVMTTTASPRIGQQGACRYVALAATLQNFDSYQLESPAILSNPVSSAAEWNAHNSEARTIWQQVATFHSPQVTLSDSASAYYGLCSNALNNALTELAYFYCKRAEEFYSRLPASLRDTSFNRQSEASVINSLGMALYKEHQTVDGTDDWLCAEDSVIIGTLNASGAVKRKIWRGPYSRPAMRYFELAKALQPSDETIACSAALAAYALGAKEPMRALETKPSARLWLGDSFEQLAKAYGNNEYYLLALDEYGMAIKYDPDSIWALNNYAYTFWQFRATSPGEMLPARLGDVGTRAEEYARLSALLANERMSKQDNAAIQSTLGEVLLGEARPTEAIQVLKAAMQYVPDHPMFDETHWDLAQAYLCQNARGGLHGKAGTVAQQEAASQLERIRKSALERNDIRWLSDPEILDSLSPALACLQYLRPTEPDKDFHFVLKGGKPTYSRVSPCNWEEVVGAVRSSEDLPLRGFLLHVWGGGVNSEVNVGPTPSLSIFLGSEPRDTEDLYFAQLWANRTQPLPGVFEPVSEIVPIQTYSGAANVQCQRNEMILTFAPQP